MFRKCLLGKLAQLMEVALQRFPVYLEPGEIFPDFEKLYIFWELCSGRCFFSFWVKFVQPLVETCPRSQRRFFSISAKISPLFGEALPVIG